MELTMNQSFIRHSRKDRSQASQRLAEFARLNQPCREKPRCRNSILGSINSNLSQKINGLGAVSGFVFDLREPCGGNGIIGPFDQTSTD